MYQLNPQSGTLDFPTLQPPRSVRPGESIDYPTLLPGLAVTANAPAAGSGDGLTRITVYGSLRADKAGTAQTGTVTFRQTIYDPVADALVTGPAYTAPLTAAGQMSIPLPASDDPANPLRGCKWFVIEPSGASYYIDVPAASPGGQLDLATAPRVAAPGTATQSVDTGALLDSAAATALALTLIGL